MAARKMLRCTIRLVREKSIDDDDIHSNSGISFANGMCRRDNMHTNTRTRWYTKFKMDSEFWSCHHRSMIIFSSGKRTIQSVSKLSLWTWHHCDIRLDVGCSHCLDLKTLNESMFIWKCLYSLCTCCTVQVYIAQRNRISRRSFLSPHSLLLSIRCIKWIGWEHWWFTTAFNGMKQMCSATSGNRNHIGDTD